ncbi:hypothetical protein BCR44DRAFT_1434227 [Catenaria anguillulae PL171]|uniref:Uncharacterized protein n=1 Tax=Catenaria anguillulae PL171 TaxID=765915 RepID=A0A1Y2HLJ6_9FUNG|nr:hypothetical protein BCR44DRAFT_1434227 [Catenaria anguillulae PL171]
MASVPHTTPTRGAVRGALAAAPAKPPRVVIPCDDRIPTGVLAAIGNAMFATCSRDVAGQRAGVAVAAGGQGQGAGVAVDQDLRLEERSANGDIVGDDKQQAGDGGVSDDKEPAHDGGASEVSEDSSASQEEVASPIEQVVAITSEPVAAAAAATTTTSGLVAAEPVAAEPVAATGEVVDAATEPNDPEPSAPVPATPTGLPTIGIATVAAHSAVAHDDVVVPPRSLMIIPLEPATPTSTPLDSYTEPMFRVFNAAASHPGGHPGLPSRTPLTLP